MLKELYDIICHLSSYDLFDKMIYNIQKTYHIFYLYLNITINQSISDLRKTMNK
jgi:hypothetical protein